MPTSPDRRQRLAVVGASTLRGKEIVQLLEDGPFAAAGVHLFDDVRLAGTLTAAGGEPAFLQPLEADSLAGTNFVFFSCERDFAIKHLAVAESAGANVIDLSGALAAARAALPWIPPLDAILPPPRPPSSRQFYSPSAAAIVSCTFAAALRAFAVRRIVIVFFQPVSERGPEGIAELESQTVKLLSFQPLDQAVFDSQVAFNLLDDYGEESRVRLEDSRAAVRAEVAMYLGGRVPVPAVQIIHAPVFHSMAFSVFLEMAAPCELPELDRALAAVGIKAAAAGEAAPSNVSVAGNSDICIAAIRRDASIPTGFWLWGAVDNVRLAAHNAVRIAEKILASS
jgi:aspartate-semialdehyde dehydrogenase